MICLFLSNCNDINLENSQILSKKIIGREDVDISAMIDRLNNSDWVNKGRKYFENNEDRCPFCQQRTINGLSEKLNSYFDDSYSKDINAIKKLASDYKQQTSSILQHLNEIIKKKPLYLNCTELDNKKKQIEMQIDANKQHLEKKIKEPSVDVKMEIKPITILLQESSEVIKEANDQIKKHNNLTNDREKNKEELNSKAWNYFIHKNKTLYENYNHEISMLQPEVKKLDEEIKNNKTEKKGEDDNIQELKKNITSIEPTIVEINYHRLKAMVCENA